LRICVRAPWKTVVGVCTLRSRTGSWKRGGRRVSGRVLGRTVKRDLVCVKRDLVCVKRDLVRVKGRVLGRTVNLRLTPATWRRATEEKEQWVGAGGAEEKIMPEMRDCQVSFTHKDF